jgi:hypothetical protein
MPKPYNDECCVKTAREKLSSQCPSGVVLVRYPDNLDIDDYVVMNSLKPQDKSRVKDAIDVAADEAREACDSALIKLVKDQRAGARILELHIIEETTCPHCGQPMCDDETCS